MTVSECKYRMQQLKVKATEFNNDIVDIACFTELYDICIELFTKIDECDAELLEVIEDYESQLTKEKAYSDFYKDQLSKTNDALCSMIDFVKGGGFNAKTTE